jgi:signal transduction histidine kinase
MSSEDALFGHAGEMAVRLAAHDWSSTPLGPIESWSQSLRTAVAIVLRSRYPMLLNWGEQLVMLYNDAFIPTLGTKHPDAVGGLLREQFAEVWGDIGSMQESVLAGGPATWDEDLRLMIERGAGPEEAFFTFSYSHVPDEAGPGGVLAVLTVTTAKVVAARRLGLLHDLALVANEATVPDEAMAAALEVLAMAEQDLLGGALYGLPSESPDEAQALVRTGVFGDADPGLLPGRIGPGTDHPAVQAWDTRSPVHATDTVALPVRGQDQVEAVLVLVPHPRRPFDEDHEKFVGLVADQVRQILAVATARARERARLEALAALDAAKTAFLSNVSHEFRTPLTLLLGPLEDVLDGREQAIGRADAEVMYANAHRLLRMVNALLDVARIETDGLTSAPETTDLVQITRDVLQPFATAATRAGLVLETELDPGLGLVVADPELWEKIVVNLVANAIKFTSDGSVRVSLTRRDDEVVLRVTDTGLGIPEAEVARVFDRFHRVQNDGSRNIQGTGVGLTLVAEAARAMGGSAVAESVLGVGSTFEVRLPLLRDTDATEARWDPHLESARALAEDLASYAEEDERSNLPETPGGPDSKVILVVEDNPAMRSRIARLLSTLGEVTTAPDGRAALETLRSTHVDLVVSDVMMPRLDGIGLLAAIRGDETLRSTPVVLLSARAGSEAAAGGIDAGADDYVVKPFTPDELLARCRTSLELAEYRARTAASRVRSALLAGVSHDMQTPLAVITTSLGLLGEPDLDDEQRNRIAARARIRASQLTRLVTQFLDWSRLSMNQPLPIRMELVDLVEVVAEVASEHDRISVSADTESAEIWCDRQRTEQILHNLVENAQRVARSGVEIQLDGDEETMTVRIADDGTGVSPEVLPWLFEAFGPSTGGRGNGLGLHVSREAARAQGGTLELESTGAEGSVFTLGIPRQRHR